MNYRRLCLFLALTSFVCEAKSRGESPLALMTVDGPARPAKLNGFVGSRQVQFLVDSEEPVPFSAEQLVRWGMHRDQWSSDVILLNDGGWFSADSLSMTDRECELENRILGTVKIERKAIRAVILHTPSDPFERDELCRRCQDSRSAKDQLWLLNGDILTGTISRPSKPAANKPTDRSDSNAATSISFRMGESSRSLSVPEQRIQAIVMADPPAVPGKIDSKSVWLIGLRDGSLIRVRDLQNTAASLQIELSAGIRLKVPVKDFVPNVDFIQSMQSQATYLSDLEPSTFRHIPFLSQSWNYSRDRTVTGTLLRHARQIYFRGIGMHSSARLDYELDGKYQTFAATIALDERARERGSVLFRVLIDRNGQWEQAYASPNVHGRDPAIPIQVDVSKVKRMSLVVDFADDGDVCDYANWLDARLIPWR